MMQLQHSNHYKEKIWTYLNRDPLKHIVHLKMLTAHPEAIQPHYFADQGSAGVLLLLRSQAFSYDARVYPSAKTIVILSGDHADIYRQMIDLIPTDDNLVFKLIDDQAKVVPMSAFKI